MYRKHFGLARNPFDITPDPYFLFPTPKHNEALASLYYGVQRQMGSVVMTGEVGTGKTLMLRCVMELLSRCHTEFAYVFNTTLSPIDFLQYVAGDFGLAPAESKGQLLVQLNRFLIDRHQRGLATALIVDEGQLLSWEVLEEIRLLTNLENSRKKLLQILLVGQSELEQKLDSVELRQLKQRIALRCRLEALTLPETVHYIHRRLHLAGANGRALTLFPEDSIGSVFEHSKGIPRLVNTICENALIAAYGRQLNTVPKEIIYEIASDFRLLPTAAPPRRSEQLARDVVA
jgi:general secretion pathway protein A